MSQLRVSQPQQALLTFGMDKSVLWMINSIHGLYPSDARSTTFTPQL